jgi:putative endopeptidase
MIKKPTALGIAVIAAALLLFFSCSKTEKKELYSGVILKNMDTLVKPGDNFTAYVNGTWMKKTHIPADKSYYGAMDIIGDQAEKDVRAIIEESAKGDFKDGSNEQKIGDYYQSYMDMKARDAKGIQPIMPELKQIDAIANYSEVAAWFGAAGAKSQMAPLSVSVAEDFKDPTKYMLMTWQGGLGMPEREYYMLSDAKSKEIRTKYLAHMVKMLELCGIQNAAEKANRIMALETLIASKHMKKEDTRNTVALYNKYAVKDLTKLTGDFDWKAMLKTAGTENQDSIVVAQVDYAKNLSAIVKSTPLDTWKDYLKWCVITSSGSDLTSALDKEDFDFYGKTLYGKPEQQPQWKRAVSAVNNAMGEIIGEVYVKKHFTPEAKERMTELVKNLLKAYEESIKTLDWMSADTKKEALSKVSKFLLKIGYPDKWRDYSDLKIVKGDHYGNARRASEFEYNRKLHKMGKPVDKTEWGMTPQTVNAYYNPTFNEIVFPAAILQPPFFDMNADDAVNYGSIGAVIGHEIGHGFDDQGKDFDGNGVMRNWWTDADLTAFKQKTGALVSQYNEFQVFPDLHVNGAYTLGENIGDLGGLTIGLKAYKMSLKGKPAPKMDGFTGVQRVFIGWGQVWNEKAREAALRSQVASDPHSPAKFRVNGIVRNLPEFYEAFNVKPGDSLYLAPEKRVRIW